MGINRRRSFCPDSSPFQGTIIVIRDLDSISPSGLQPVLDNTLSSVLGAINESGIRRHEVKIRTGIKPSDLTKALVDIIRTRILFAESDIVGESNVLNKFTENRRELSYLLGNLCRRPHEVMILVASIAWINNLGQLDIKIPGLNDTSEQFDLYKTITPGSVWTIMDRSSNEW